MKAFATKKSRRYCFKAHPVRVKVKEKFVSLSSLPSFGVIKPNGSFTLHGTGTGIGTDKQWVSLLCYVMYTLHSDRDRDREPLLPPANEVWGKVIFSVACVKNSVHIGGLPQCMLGYHPLPPTPPEQTPPPGPGTPLPAQYMLGDTVNKRAVCILLECNLVFYCALSMP